MGAVLAPGTLLLAEPGLADPNFEGTVVLLCAHGAEGSLGLVLNRPVDLRLDQVISDPGPFRDGAPRMYWGGPVGMDRLHVLHGGAAGPSSMAVCAGVTFGGDLEELARLHAGAAPVRFFLGYSGWDASQLDAELADSVWRVAPASAETVFDPDPPSLWKRLVAAQDPHYRWLRHAPADPRVN